MRTPRRAQGKPPVVLRQSRGRYYTHQTEPEYSEEAHYGIRKCFRDSTEQNL